MFSWDSVDGLNKLLNIVVVSWAVISLVLGILSWRIQSRLSDLTSFNDKKMQRKVLEADQQVTEMREKYKEIEAQLRKYEAAPVETVVLPQKMLEDQYPELTKVKKETPPPVKEETPTVVVGFDKGLEQKFISFLADKPKGEFSIKSIAGDDESFQYAKQIERILVAAGYTSKGISESTFRTPPKGVSIIVKSINSAPPYSGVIQKAFELLNVRASGEVNGYYPENTLTIVVGRRTGF